jgi:hypothetical protein
MLGWFSINRASLAFGGAQPFGPVAAVTARPRMLLVLDSSRGLAAVAGRPAGPLVSRGIRGLALAGPVQWPTRLLACCAQWSHCSSASAWLRADLGRCRGRCCVVNGALARPPFACPYELPNRCYCRPSRR